jgi:L-aspartate oxidase
MALAYVAGAELMDMEFVQFHPTALRLKNARAILISEAVRGEGARLVNRAGVRFMPNYHELAELAPRDVVTAAIHQEMHAAGTDHVLLTLDALSPEFIVSRFPNIHQACLAEGLDITREPIPVAPAAHYSIGGVRTDLDGQTTLQGLWACGEVAATGVHGANRLASNSLLECLVFARRAVDRTTEMGVPPVPRGADKDVVPLARDEAGPPPLELAGLGQLMTDDVGVVRHADGLRRARDTMEAWAPAGAPPSISSRLIVARLMAEAALLRTETRGAHVRADYPHDEERWRRHIVFRKGAEPRCLGA